MLALRAVALLFVLIPGLAKAEMVEINGSELFVERLGEGPAILMMHGGLGLDHTYFRPYFDRLAEAYTLIYYDHLGNGRSDDPGDWAELTLDRLVADAEALRQELDLGEIILLGHSYGGFVAQTYAEEHGEHLRGLVLIGTVPAIDYGPEVIGTPEQMQAFGSLFAGLPDDASWREAWNLTIPMYFDEADPEILARLDEATIYSHEAWNIGIRLLPSFNVLETLPTLEVPILAVAGRSDGITPHEAGASRIASLAPQGQVALFNASGHYPFIEEEIAFFVRLGEFLDELE